MRDTGLTHGGFYKHFRNKDDLLVESLREPFREFTDTLVHVAEQSPAGEAWKAIVRAYLRPEMCDHPERGCPLASCARISAGRYADEALDHYAVVNYKSRMVPFMPGKLTMDKERAFFAIFSTMMGAIEVALDRLSQELDKIGPVQPTSQLRHYLSQSVETRMAPTNGHGQRSRRKRKQS